MKGNITSSVAALSGCRTHEARQAGGAVADDGDDEGEGERSETRVREAGRAQEERNEGRRCAHGYSWSR